MTRGRARAGRLPSEARCTRPRSLLLAAPRGYCAGVDRAVQTVERALDCARSSGLRASRDRAQQARGGELLESRRDLRRPRSGEIPEGSITVFSAHGVSPAVHADAERRRCRRSTRRARLSPRSTWRWSASPPTATRSCSSAIADHDEVVGTMGEAPENIVVVETRRTSIAREVPDADKVAFIFQTTLWVERRGCIMRGARAVPAHHRPAHRRHLLRDHEPAGGGEPDGRRDGSGARDRLDNRSNSKRLVDVARTAGAASHLIDNADQVQEEWLEGARVVGISSGAQRARGAGQATRRLLPRARHLGRLGLRGHARGRAVHAAQADQSGNDGRGGRLTRPPAISAPPRASSTQRGDRDAPAEVVEERDVRARADAGVDAGRAVGVHHDDRPPAVLDVPVQRLRAGALGRGRPERLRGRAAAGRRSPRLAR